MKRRHFLRNMTAAAAASALPRGLRAQATEYAIHNQPPRQPGNAAQAFSNQIGFTPERRKAATVVVPAGPAPAAEFRIVSIATGATAFAGQLSGPLPDPHSGDTAAHADFSAFKQPGQYQLDIGGKLGDPFAIHADAYRPALRSTVRAYYGQRCGCAVDLGHGYRHPPCHLHGGFDASSGRTGKLRNAGGWHDAGDYGRYVVNCGITVATLLLAWEMFPAALRHLHLDIPESGRNLPDYLAEVKWNLDWMLSLQDHTDGGVWHKQSSRQFCGFIMPQDDPMPSYVIGTGTAPYKSTGATADFAAVMAIAARIYREYEPAFADRCLTAARRAWVWAMLHPAVIFENPTGIDTGGYGDHDLADELLWATAEMFRTTGEQYIEQQFLVQLQPMQPMQQIDSQLRFDSIDASVPGWGNVGSLGLWAYWLAGGSSGHARDAIAASTLANADDLVRRANASGYGHTMTMRDYFWGSNAVVGNQGLLLLMADRIAGSQGSPNPAYRAAALANMDYVLGRNCLGTSWVTQVGVRTPQNPHHRPSGSDHIAAPWPGLLVGGPNAGGGDRIADALPKQPPMRMWADDARAYSLNEVAINWNAPLVFLLAAANAP